LGELIIAVHYFRSCTGC